jgi:hypothetical protein
MLPIGGTMLLENYEPARLYVALGGAAFLAVVAPLLKFHRLKWWFKVAAAATAAGCRWHCGKLIT